MTRKLSLFAALFAALCLIVASAGASAHHKAGHAGGNGNNKGKGGGSSVGVSIGSDGRVDVDLRGDLSIRFSDSEIRIIDDYYRRYPSSGYGLPPGIAKNLARGKPLPPGIAKRYLPNNLVGLLPSPLSGTNRVIIGSDIFLIELSTGLILDVIEGVLN